MTPDRLDPADHAWMTAPHARAAMDALERARPDCARFVGGCVRNALMGEPVGDIDIATQLTPEETIAALEAAGLKAVPTGIEHGTVTAVIDGAHVEVTTLRRDVETDGRRAVVAFTEDWDEDSARRDFRFNAIYCAPDGTLSDPQGGIADAEARRVVFIGEADARIAEDALRILRFFRLSAQYGRGRPDRYGLLACARGKAMLSGLSGERVWSELNKLLSAAAPEATLRWMQTAEILRAAIGPCHGLETAAQLSRLARERDWAPDGLLMLAALTEPGETRARELADRLKFSRAERARLMSAARITFGEQNAKATPKAVSGADEARELQQRLYRDGVDCVRDDIALRWARMRADAARDGKETDAIDAAFAQQDALCRKWNAPEFPISGKDLKDAGFSEGEALGAALSQLESRWIESGFVLTRAELLRDADALRDDER